MASHSDPALITNQNQMQALVAALANEPVISVDTESNSLFAYQERVCLIQFSTAENDFLVDPLILEDVSGLGGIFSDPKIEKIFHAAEYDILCLKRDYGFTFSNLFDTMVSARILGRKKVGLGNLLASEFNVHLEKRYQKADWGKRPLSADMLAYARMDTHHLIRLRNKFAGELEAAVSWPVARDDFNRLCNLNGKPPGPVGKNVWRVHGVRDLSNQQAAVLQELVNYRDKKGQDYDLPVFKVFSDRSLVAIAAQTPKNLTELKYIQGITDKQANRHGKQLVEAVRRGLQAQPIKRPKKPDFGAGYSERLEALREWRKATAQPLGVESDVVLPRDIMLAIAIENPKDTESISALIQSSPWRIKTYQQQIREVLAEL